MCPAALSEQHARFQAFLGGTLPLPLITQRYIAGQNTSCKYRRFESVSAESHENRCVMRVCGRAHKSSIKAARQLVPRKGEMLQGICCNFLLGVLFVFDAKNQKHNQMQA
ncbi:hypothetical protein D7V82_17510 [bacterium 1xD8-6]|nr:hypothetical protein D7V72_18790 [bacterium D16-36]RKI64877.1 hypothetical protein D7V82_17510 [bacterium 1xD8-6]